MFLLFVTCRTEATVSDNSLLQLRPGRLTTSESTRSTYVQIFAQITKIVTIPVGGVPTASAGTVTALHVTDG